MSDTDKRKIKPVCRRCGYFDPNQKSFYKCHTSGCPVYNRQKEEREIKEFIVTRTWIVKATNAEEAIRKSKDTKHAEVNARLKPQIGKGPGGYIPF